MGLFDIFKKKKNDISIETIISSEYRQIYFDECKYIWKNYVPKNGQSNCLQGELLREIEKIRCEAQDNGNINWDDDYSYFCDFIVKSLNSQSIFNDNEKEETAVIMNYINDCGFYAQQVNNGEISQGDIDISKIAYTKDNLYDIICDKIGKLHQSNPSPIPYQINHNLKR